MYIRTFKSILVILLLGVVGVSNLSAQIGYQVALLNSATGEARANEKVTVNISLSNSANEVFYTETKQATTNDFGVLSLTIGNEDTFSEVDLSKLPFFISVTVNGVLVGRTQVLTVPVAEAAKRVVPIDKDKIVGSWTVRTYKYGAYIVHLNNDGTGTYQKTSSDSNLSKPFNNDFMYEIDGNVIYCYFDDGEAMMCRYYNGFIKIISRE